MAIKGKGRTKPRQVAKAPRRAPVVMKPKLWQRRWVQMSAAFVLGILVVSLALWVRSGLRSSSDESDAQARTARRAGMLTGWQAAVDGAVGTVGTLTPGAKPDALPGLTAALAKLTKGTVPDGVATTLDADAEKASAAVEQLEGFDAASAIRTAAAFDKYESLQILDSQNDFLLALRLYGRSATLAADAARAEGAQIKGLAEQAEELRALASSTLEDATDGYQELLLGAGLLNLAPPGALPPTGG
jgi:hypothetical protein